MRVLLTGAAGFVGSFVARRLIERGDHVLALDDFNDVVYPAALKRDRASRLARLGLIVWDEDLRKPGAVERLIAEGAPEVVVHLAALANPRVSVQRPADYFAVNLSATEALLEAMRRGPVRKIVFASSSTVYGANPSYPWHEELPADRPLSPYAATKRACELLLHAYHVSYGFDAFCLRFFTAYGPWGRPDMMPVAITRALFERRRFTLFDEGRPQRDFTYVEDVAAGVVAAVDRVARYEVINLGRGEPVAMTDFVRQLEETTGEKALWDTAPLPPSDAPITYADVSKARRILGYDPLVPLRAGLEELVAWHRAYYAPGGR